MLANDTDPAGPQDPLEDHRQSQNPAHGTAEIKPLTGPLPTRLIRGMLGRMAFEYTIADGDEGTDSAAVTVTVGNLVDVSGRSIQRQTQ